MFERSLDEASDGVATAISTPPTHITNVCLHLLRKYSVKNKNNIVIKPNILYILTSFWLGCY